MSNRFTGFFMDFIKIFISFISLAVLSMPGMSAMREVVSYGTKWIIIALVVSFATSFFKLQTKDADKYLFPFDLATVLILMRDYCKRWAVAGKMTLIASRFHLPTDIFLIITSIILGALGIYAINVLLHLVIKGWQKAFEHFKYKDYLSNAAYVIVIACFQYFQLQYSVIGSFEQIHYQNRCVVLINILLLIALNVLLATIITWKPALILSSCACTIWAVINYYVIKYHGSPFYFSELINTRTALAVAGGYSYYPDLIVLGIMALCGAQLTVCLKAWVETKQKPLIRIGENIVILVAVLAVLFMNKNVIIPVEAENLPWNNEIKQYGFPVCMVRDVTNASESFRCPDGYDPQTLTSVHAENTAFPDEYPDIIFILNETFCDIEYYADIQADADYMKAFYSVEDAHYGYAITPGIGGGTNNAEFELLYSKSMYLLNSTAPFTWMNTTLETRNIVQYLESLGYSSTGMHCGGGANYNRDRAYPAVGFDNIYLGPDSFKYLSYSGNRSWKDSDNYKDLEEHYEEGKGNQQFMFLLTLQNHGGFEKNDDSLDTVHTTVDYGSLTDDINEYLSSVQLSSEAFTELIDYYRNEERPVIIMMVGDHAPSFITELKSNNQHPEIDESVLMRTVPYAVWSNYGVDFSDVGSFVSMTDFVPVILKCAGLPMSDFYETIYELHETLPVRTSTGDYIDALGQYGTYSTDSKYYGILNQYYSLEYNSLMSNSEYREEFFIPAVK